MSKFEEWFETTSGWTGHERDLAEVAWNAALDEAAKVCQKQLDSADGCSWNEASDECVAAILALKDK